MREKSQTLIASVREAVNAWRKREGWSREAVAQEIVKHYDEHDGAVVTGVRFDPNTRDIFERAKVNADRIFRWLDDDSKDGNLLPANMLPYLLHALPRDLRIACADEILQPADLSVRVMDAEVDADLTMALQHMAKECGEAVAAMANLIDGATPDELQAAQQEVTEALAAATEALALVEARLKGQIS
jgi:hypothetical protein